MGTSKICFCGRLYFSALYNFLNFIRMASIILRRRGLMALERATNTTSSLRWFSAEGNNKNIEENSGTSTDGKIDFGKNTMPRSVLKILPLSLLLKIIIQIQITCLPSFALLLHRFHPFRFLNRFH